jgi:hypothetical protein
MSFSRRCWDILELEEKPPSDAEVPNLWGVADMAVAKIETDARDQTKHKQKLTLI